MDNPLPCFVCGVQLGYAGDPVLTGRVPNHPSGGVAFDSPGHYGSAVFDPGRKDYRLELAVCDQCLCAAHARTRETFCRNQRLLVADPAQRELETDLPGSRHREVLRTLRTVLATKEADPDYRGQRCFDQLVLLLQDPDYGMHLPAAYHELLSSADCPPRPYRVLEALRLCSIV